MRGEGGAAVVVVVGHSTKGGVVVVVVIAIHCVEGGDSSVVEGDGRPAAVGVGSGSVSAAVRFVFLRFLGRSCASSWPSATTAAFFFFGLPLSFLGFLVVLVIVNGAPCASVPTLIAALLRFAPFVVVVVGGVVGMSTSGDGKLSSVAAFSPPHTSSRCALSLPCFQA